ncbi:DUF5301 domain-containing protein [uncultured Tissierella sp.]|uniref:DUF5301 domain-containing protein n=1 Tax=uncultured Tissierella sp. TaxID=448160 RepID=UPI00280479C7|nr:DUF5301 domain-containing protein [uncultured Tissierella sp.]MDU5080506.1 DUF5301 domain-containing protein [Bacillota bacterium]
MIDRFIAIINMSLTASYVALGVMIVRLLLKKVPKIFSYILWSIVLFRLICPFSFESSLSLMYSSDISKEVIYTQVPNVSNKVETIDNMINAVNEKPIKVPHSGTSVNPMELALRIGSRLWVLGMIILLSYGLFSYFKLKHRLATAILIQDNIYETDLISTPFVLGFIRPQIYIPVGLDMNDFDYILKHEQMHIRRRDYLIKPIAFIALAIHWFNPIIWISFVLMVKDMEMSCDESVMKQSREDIRGSYSNSLLSISIKQNGLISPISFGGGNTKGRIKNILNYKRPRFWIVFIGIFVVITTGIILLSNPKTLSPKKIDFSVYEIYKNRTEYVGDNVKVVNIVDRLPISQALTRSKVELFTKEEPYVIEITYDTSRTVREYFSGTVNQNVFDQNAILIFALVGNVEYVNFVLDDGENNELIQRTRDWANYNMNEDIWKDSSTMEQFDLLSQKVMDNLAKDDISYELDILALINNGKRTKRLSVNDAPYVENYKRIEVIGEIYYIYEDGNKYYVEKPYEFINELTGEDYNDINNTNERISGKIEESDNKVSQEIVDMIEENLSIIMSSPKDASNPWIYIDMHQNEYEEIIKNGEEEALQYMISQFEAGNIDGLRGQIMMILCKELLGDRNNVIDEALSPEEWFSQLNIK